MEAAGEAPEYIELAGSIYREPSWRGRELDARPLGFDPARSSRQWRPGYLGEPEQVVYTRPARRDQTEEALWPRPLIRE